MEDISPTEYTISVIPPEERLSTDKITLYELSNAVSKRIAMLSGNSTIYTGDIPVVELDSLPSSIKSNIKSDKKIMIGDKGYIQLVHSSDIAKLELNKRKSPLSVIRTISCDFEKKIKHVEIIPVNELYIPPQEYNLDITG